MKKLYIKFEVNGITLVDAVKEAERLGYHRDERAFSLNVRERKELILHCDGNYFTNFGSESNRITPEDEGYTEHIINSSKYYVLVENRGEPRTIHQNFQSADAEAQRLARLERRDTYVLKIEKKYGIEIVAKDF